MKYILGIDQGGTKTHALVGDDSGHILGVGSDAGACHSVDGMDRAMDAVAGAAGKTRLTRGITLGIHHVFDAKYVILQVGGAHKANIVERFVKTPPTEAIPATALKLLRHSTLVVDRDAAANVLDLLVAAN